MNVLLIDNNKIFLEGLSMLLKENDSIDTIHSTINVDNVQSLLAQHSIDLAIIDLNMGQSQNDGIILCRELKNNFPELHIIILTSYLKVRCIEELIVDIQINGYASKDSGKLELFEAIRVVSNGGTYIDSIAAEILQSGNWNSLTKREIEILDLLSSGMIKKEIATQLGRSEHTIRRHIENAKIKFNARNSAHLVGMYNKYKSSTHEDFLNHTPPFVQ